MSNSVATAIEFLKEAYHPDYLGAEGTINFIRIVDKLFDLLNSKNPFAKGYKKPLRLVDHYLRLSTIKSSINYLSKLQDVNGTQGRIQG